MRICNAVILFGVLFCSAAFATEAVLEDTALADIGKKSTVLVELAGGEGYGSAFCIDAQGYFLTDNHVVAHATNSVKLIIAPGQANQKVINAKVVRADEHLDLALLKIEDANLVASVTFGDDQDLSELQEIVAFGFPFGKELSLSAGEYPSISVNKGRVTALRKKDGKLNRIQLDAVVNPGNSGGPILDKHGRVIGLVVSGVLGAGAVNFAIPASHAREFLHKPEITVKTPPLDGKALNAEAQLTVHLTSFSRTDYKVELAIKNAQGIRQITPDKQDNGDYTFKFVPLAEEPQKVANLIATFASGSLHGPVDDRVMTMGDKTFKLSEVRSIKPGTPGEVILANDEKLSGLPAGLNAIMFTMGGTSIRADLTSATLIEVKPPDARARQISYTVTVKYDGVSEQTSGDLLTAVPAAAPGTSTPAESSEIKPLPVANGNTEVKFPGPIDDVVVGGNGRYLIALISKLHKLAVFDANKGEITKYLSVPEHVLFAAGESKLIVLVTDNNVIQRYSLDTFERELSAQSPVSGVVKSISMGCASEGPLLMAVSVGTEALDHVGYRVVDINKLSVVELHARATNMDPLVHYSSYRDSIHIRASADGSTFGMWSTSGSPSGVGVVTYTSGSWSSAYEHDTHGYVVPSADGGQIYTIGCAYTGELKKLDGLCQRGMAYLPVYQSSFFIGFHAELYAHEFDAQHTEKHELYLFAPGSSKPVLTLPSTTAAWRNDMWAKNDFSIDKRFFVLLKSNLIVTIPDQNDRLVLNHFNLAEAMKSNDVDYLFVSSTPPRLVEKHKAMSYKITVESRQGGIKLSLDSGPKNMTLSADGVLSWTPGDDADADTGVIIRISDKSGQEVFHSFSLKLK